MWLSFAKVEYKEGKLAFLTLGKAHALVLCSQEIPKNP